MNDIPDEIMERAREVYTSIHHSDWGWEEEDFLAIAIARAIMEAVAAEREECAKVAATEAANHAKTALAEQDAGNWRTASLETAGAFACDKIAAAIRARGEPTHYPVKPPPLEPDSFTREELKEAVDKVSKGGSNDQT